MLEDVQGLSEDAAKLATSPLWSLPDGELVSCLQAVHRWDQAVAALKLRVVQEIHKRGIPGSQGHRTTAGLLRTLLLMDPGPAAELAARATALIEWPTVERALRRGALDARQASVITDTLGSLPETLDAMPPGADVPDRDELVAKAEATLIEMAGQFPAAQLRRLGDRILAYVAPEIADRADEATLRRQEARAFAKRSFTLSHPIDGMVRIYGMLGVEDAAIVGSALDPLCTPRAGDERSPAQRRADALVDVCRIALRTSDLPANGGEPPQLAVTVAFDPLAGQFGSAATDNGDRISAASARRLACDARIMPVVFGGASQILDVGRARRVANGALRRALAVRDRGCAFPGCDRPPRWCDAHHMRPWAEGGPTNLDNLVLLCRHHHRILHDSACGWQVRLGKDRLPEFVPPSWTDPQQLPRRNLYHPRT